MNRDNIIINPFLDGDDSIFISDIIYAVLSDQGYDAESYNWTLVVNVKENEDE